MADEVVTLVVMMGRCACGATVMQRADACDGFVECACGNVVTSLERRTVQVRPT